MKKLWLISALSLGLVLLAGCNTPSSQVTINSSADMIALYNESKAMTCTMSYSVDNESGTSTIYIKDSMIRQDTASNVDWEEITVYTLARDGKTYAWGNLYGENVWMYITYDMDVEEELTAFDELDSATKITCAAWVKDDSVFELPTDIEFTSMDDLYWGLTDYYYEEYDETYNEEEEISEVEETNEAEETNDEVEETNESWEDAE